ncbi:hypothetical protein DFA_02395 [Cavenderia fasciculata]|uniref:Uncharacterized protein n=1 Tax=Cavenderia fasciculata TaxID=261658 RepID=F4PZB9_CACFS|nr:uncharacterized protein DFA_02395 [Cavenderia fasciculata]EGG19148.1 hypothetical protein DFA_02395 [Cavenderia fasciculata]|eukprot:XP_004366781.1 hypothetical protein DFA_02395 [Cavenderia fasciculata]
MNCVCSSNSMSSESLLSMSIFNSTRFFSELNVSRGGISIILIERDVRLIGKIPGSRLQTIKFLKDRKDSSFNDMNLLSFKKVISSLKRLIQFKEIGGPITSKGEISQQFKATATRFKLKSFKDIMANSISNPQQNDWITSNREQDTSNIETVLVKDHEYKLIDSHLYNIPSIETLFISYQNLNELDLTSISRLPNLQRLSVRTIRVILGAHISLKSLKLCTNAVNSLINLDLTRFVSLTAFSSRGLLSNIGAGSFPISITSLNLRSTDMLLRDTFLSLTSLVTLKIQLPIQQTHNVTNQLPCIDLFNLNNLTKFRIKYFSQDPNYNIEIRVPPSIKMLNLESRSVCIPSQYEMPLLEELYVQRSVLIVGKVSLSSCPLIKLLSIGHCFDAIPTNMIPSTIEKLRIYKHTNDNILEKVIFPSSLTHLSVLGIYIEPVQLPLTLIKLKQRINESSLHKNNDNYPPHLETLNFFDIQGDFKINIPPITKDLSISLNPNLDSNSLQIYSISTRINKPTIDQSQQWLPINTTHLTCFLKDSRYYRMMAFRLDEVINHTNVRYLTLSLYRSKLQFSIQRLDSDNKSVLVLERQTLTGGIITQRKSSNNQQQQLYDPIYLQLS